MKLLAWQLLGIGAAMCVMLMLSAVVTGAVAFFVGMLLGAAGALLGAYLGTRWGA